MFKDYYKFSTFGVRKIVKAV